MIYTKTGKSKLPERYEKLAGTRNSYLSRGQDYSKMTLPYILPMTAPSASASNKHGYQGIGAEAVNHLANKVTSTLFPVTEPFFSMDLDPDVEKELQGRGLNKSKLAAYFNGLADLAIRKMTKLRMRPQLVNYQKHLIISGNSCLVFTDKGVKQLGLDKYVCKRDPTGNLLEAITLEKIAFNELPPAVQVIILTQNPGKKREQMEEQHLYTGYKLEDDGDAYLITQSVGNLDVMSSKTVDAEKLPIIIGRWNATSGEDYGRGLVEDHSGDFHVLEFLSEARARGAATMMDIKYLVRPGSLTDIQTLNKAPSGEFVQGMEDDIFVLQLDKYADHTFIKDIMEEYQGRISRAFLMLQDQIRDSERTTKYEIQKIANEIDTSMGGNYSSQSDELQYPCAIQLLDMVDPRLVNKNFVPLIMTGLEALGRARELEKIMQYTEMMAMPEGWVDEIRTRVIWSEYSDTIASNLSLDTTWLRSEDEQDTSDEQEVDAAGAGVMTDAIASGAGQAIGKRIGEGLG